MELYHGSSNVLKFPEIRKTPYAKDFSWGFYCTNSYEQAYKWADRKSESGVINVYSYAEKLAEAVSGTIFADAGYLQKKDALNRMEEKGIKFEAAPRKNMNRLMSRFECPHIKHRSIIESNWGTLKNNFHLEYHKARSIVGMFRHFFYSIVAYMINRNLDFYKNFFRLRLI